MPQGVPFFLCPFLDEMTGLYLYGKMYKGLYLLPVPGNDLARFFYVL